MVEGQGREGLSDFPAFDKIAIRNRAELRAPLAAAVAIVDIVARIQYE